MPPTDLRQILAGFRSVHSPKRLTHRSVEWMYYACGQGESALLLLPGYFVGAESWFQIIGLLADESRIVAPHYAPVRSVTELCSGLMAILDYQEIKWTHVVGQSIGGLYARELANRRPDRVRSLALSHASLVRPDDARRVERGVRIGMLAPQWVHRLQWKRRVRAEHSGDQPNAAFWREYVTSRVREVTKHEFVGWGQCYLDLLRNSESPSAWSGPVLIIESEDDPLTPPAERERLKAAFPRAVVHTFPDTGHWSADWRPHEYADALRHFIRVLESTFLPET